MTSSLLPRTLRTAVLRRCISTTTFLHRPIAPPPPPSPPPTPHPRTRTPLEKQFETCLQTLTPNFTQSDVDAALRFQPDPDLALDIFRWTAQQRGYKHGHATYLTMIQIAVSGKRHSVAETLIEEVLAGACPPSLPLFNAMIKFCCGRKFLFNRAFDIYKKMTKTEDAKPDMETYALLLNSLLRKFDKRNVCYVYMPAVRSLAKQMKAAGVIPDTFVLNMIIKAYSKCQELDEALRVFREMGLYGCEPNGYTYSYLVRGLCEKGRVSQGLGFYREMRGKGLVPKGSCYLILICSLAMEGRFQEGIEAAFDMIGNSMSPDLLTYRTLLEEMCRDGKGDDAFKLLEGFRKRDSFMNEKTYNALLNALHFINREYFLKITKPKIAKIMTIATTMTAIAHGGTEEFFPLFEPDRPLAPLALWARGLSGDKFPIIAWIVAIPGFSQCHWIIHCACHFEQCSNLGIAWARSVEAEIVRISKIYLNIVANQVILKFYRYLPEHHLEN